MVCPLRSRDRLLHRARSMSRLDLFDLLGAFIWTALFLGLMAV